MGNNYAMCWLVSTSGARGAGVTDRCCRFWQPGGWQGGKCEPQFNGGESSAGGSVPVTARAAANERRGALGERKGPAVPAAAWVVAADGMEAVAAGTRPVAAGTQATLAAVAERRPAVAPGVAWVDAGCASQSRTAAIRLAGRLRRIVVPSGPSAASFSGKSSSRIA